MLWILGVIPCFLGNNLIAAHQVNFQTPQQTRALSLKPVLDYEFEDWLNTTGYKWGMKVVAIVVTRRTKNENCEWSDVWDTKLKGYGIADRWEISLTKRSNSKPFAALGIGLLVEDEKYPIKWNTKIKDILPDGEW
ncbi:hypothetical protein M422DRAFT_257473 [Sphaerobolus stellatus SS14]|uniref:Beta-lactamase-related domain-containing protein n=1 Tax=Sphaerobolus stellatus (strain SS14) TaxID=990650 RepID=A0A0C9VNK2_SPHS4|nr:hypothetical protein M422DRAFT_257473 [Sphaerobolus stellatus SS14]